MFYNVPMALAITIGKTGFQISDSVPSEAQIFLGDIGEAGGVQYTRGIALVWAFPPFLSQHLMQ